MSFASPAAAATVCPVVQALQSNHLLELKALLSSTMIYFPATLPPAAVNDRARGRTAVERRTERLIRPRQAWRWPCVAFVPGATYGPPFGIYIYHLSFLVCCILPLSLLSVPAGTRSHFPIHSTIEFFAVLFAKFIGGVDTRMETLKRTQRKIECRRRRCTTKGDIKSLQRIY